MFKTVFHRAAENGVEAPLKQIFSVTSSNGGPAKNLYTKSERLTVSCRVTWALSGWVHLWNGYIMIQPIQTKTYATQSGPGPPSGQPGSCNLYRFPPCLIGTSVSSASTNVVAVVVVTIRTTYCNLKKNDNFSFFLVACFPKQSVSKNIQGCW